jgi:heat shock protein HslJ
MRKANVEQEKEPANTDDNIGSSSSGSGNEGTLVKILGVALVIAIVALVVLVAIVAFGEGSDTDAGSDGGAVLPPGITLVPTEAVATPEPGQPTALVIAPGGVNVRVGPGVQYPVIGIAPLGTKGEIIGLSQDRTWWVVRVPGVPNDQGWVAAEYVRAQDAGSVPVIQPPSSPAPETTVTPLPTPAPDISFAASRTTINAGETATLSWNVENVKAVYMFPVGASPFDYPVTGQGSRDVQPGIVTSYELRVINADDSSSSQRIEITVVGGLTGGRWVLQSYSTAATGQRTPLPATQITARFGADGGLSGSGACNSYSGTFTAYDQTLGIGRLAVTQAFCSAPEGIMDQEATVLALLGQATRFFISAGQLEIFDGSGNRILVFING